jgi:hypothetical protein
MAKYHRANTHRDNVNKKKEQNVHTQKHIQMANNIKNTKGNYQLSK